MCAACKQLPHGIAQRMKQLVQQALHARPQIALYCTVLYCTHAAHNTQRVTPTTVHTSHFSMLCQCEYCVPHTLHASDSRNCTEPHALTFLIHTRRDAAAAASGKGTPTSPGEDSPYRGRKVETNLRLFEEMTRGVRNTTPLHHLCGSKTVGLGHGSGHFVLDHPYGHLIWRMSAMFGPWNMLHVDADLSPLAFAQIHSLECTGMCAGVRLLPSWLRRRACQVHPDGTHVLRAKIDMAAPNMQVKPASGLGHRY